MNSEDIDSIILQTGLSRDDAVSLLNKHNNNIIDAIYEIMNNNTDNKIINENIITNPINVKFKEFREILDSKDEFYRNNISK